MPDMDPLGLYVQVVFVFIVLWDLLVLGISVSNIHQNLYEAFFMNPFLARFFESCRGADAIAFDCILITYCHAHEVNIQAMRPRLTSIKRSKRLRHEFFHHFSFEIHHQKLTCPLEMNYCNRKCI